jgi:hypothetical protein
MLARARDRAVNRTFWPGNSNTMASTLTQSEEAQLAQTIEMIEVITE